MFLRSFVKNNLLFRSMDPLKRKSPDRLKVEMFIGRDDRLDVEMTI